MTTAFHTTRTTRAQLKGQVSRVQKSALTEGLMSAITGLVAVLNEQRQVLAINQPLLASLGIADPAQILGLRPGEILGCVHAAESPGGCGSAEQCHTCGIAVSIATALARNITSEHSCALQVRREGHLTDRFFQVRCTPVTMSGERFYLLCLDEKTEAQKSAALQRIFFQDINNLIASLSTSPSQREFKPLAVNTWASDSYSLPVVVDRQLSLHKYMAGEAPFSPVLEATSSSRIIQELQNRLSKSPAAQGKSISVRQASSDFTFMTDPTVLLEVLSGMVTNALEATQDGGYVRVSSRRGAASVTFAVWNTGVIQPDIARRVFQRNFSTKQNFGRGLGTYFCKQLGEQILGGQVGFSSSKSGTVFQIKLRAPKQTTNAG